MHNSPFQQGEEPNQQNNLPAVKNQNIWNCLLPPTAFIAEETVSRIGFVRN